MVDAALMRGDDWIRCCICGRLHTEPYEGLATDKHGDTWDVCAGECAQLSGLDEYEQPESDE